MRLKHHRPLPKWRRCEGDDRTAEGPAGQPARLPRPPAPPLRDEPAEAPPPGRGVRKGRVKGTAGPGSAVREGAGRTPRGKLPEPLTCR